jgi:hypothetical protein
MRYVMIIAGIETEWDKATPAEQEAGMTAVYAWFDKWAAAGKIGDGGARLEPSSSARTIRHSGDGPPVVTDGPFVEAKEAIGGFVVLECDSLEEAVEVASSWPGMSDGSSTIEVRPVMPTPGPND